MSYRTDTEPVFKPEFRSGIETRTKMYGRVSSVKIVIAQRHIDSPHELVWESTPFPSPDAARRWLIEQEAMLARDEGRDPLSVCSNLGNIAFHHHWYKVEHLDHPSVPLIECTECYGEVETLVRCAAEELDWIKEVHHGN